MLVIPYFDGVAHGYIFGGFVLEKLIQRGGVFTTDGAIANVRL